MTQVMFLKGKPAVGWRNMLDRGILDLPKRRAQRFMAKHDAIQRIAQRANVQFAAQTQPDGHVVGLTEAVHLRQKPQSLLGE